jgi:hypothetical protein
MLPEKPKRLSGQEQGTKMTTAKKANLKQVLCDECLAALAASTNISARRPQKPIQRFPRKRVSF